MPVTPFPYTPLKGSEIRYITVHAFDESIRGRNWLEGVQCTLRQAPLEDVQFTALSYTWGDPEATRTIRLSGVPFAATVNLATCLWHFATDPKYHEANLWVDAICINQGDVEERNAQVRRMKDIYSAAVAVKAWIGIDIPQTRVGMQRLRDLPAQLRTESDSMLTSVDAAVTRSVLTKATEGEGAEGIEAVLLSGYWSRAWVLQELFLGKDVTVVCGRDEVPLQQFFTWDSLAFKHGEWTSDPWPLEAPIELPPAMFRLAVGRDSLPERLREARKLLCSDPRDRVYSLLGMVESWQAEAIVPDYTRPVFKVFGDVVQSQMERFDDVEVLHRGRYDDDRDPSYPSWIPDWGETVEETAFSGQSVGAYHASKGLPLSSHPWRLDRDNEKLHLSGTRLDVITAVSRCDFEHGYYDKYSRPEVAKAWLEWGYKALAPASADIASLYDRSTGPKAPRYPLGGGDETLSQACRRAVVADYSFNLSARTRQQARGNQFLFPDDPDEQWSDGRMRSHRDSPPDFRMEMCQKRMAVTSRGWIGLVAREAQAGDHVAVVVGASMPLLLRAAPENGRAGRDEGQPDEYRLVGHGYIHGLMDGAGLDMGEIGEIVIR